MKMHTSIYWFAYGSKCDILVNNLSQTFNGVIIGLRQKPIVSMIEDKRGYIMERLANNWIKMEGPTPRSMSPRIKKKKN